jgi:hypothetical protein
MGWSSSWFTSSSLAEIGGDDGRDVGQPGRGVFVPGCCVEGVGDAREIVLPVDLGDGFTREP